MADPRPPLETFGLTHNPFTDTAEEFFGGGDRARQLDELRHLSRWSRRLLAVTGERGVGKTTLYRAVSNRLDPGVKAARINANLTSDTRAVLAAIIHGFGIAAPANAQPQLLSELILLHVQEQIDAKRYCLVLVDDAHLLELRALEQLLSLTDASSDEGLRMVFFAEAYFVQSLDKAARRTSHVQSWHEIRLAPFTDEESREYIRFRLEQAGAAGRTPLTQAQLALIVGGSSGLPGRINAFASAVLSGDLLADDERRALPRMHRALALLVVIAAGMGWLIFKDIQVALPPPSQDPDRPVVTGGETAALAIPPVSPTAAGDDSAQSDRSRESADAADEMPTAVTDSTAGESPQPDFVEPERVVPATKPAEKPEQPPSPPVVATPKKMDTVPAQTIGEARSAQWIRAQPGSRFTLQLFATSNREQREKFLRQQEHRERFATFQTRRDGAVWYIVTYGSYADRVEAEAAAKSLPTSFGGVKPWIRTFASVQATIE
jgi:DamX protein